METPLPELWRAFNAGIALSPISDSGYVSLSGIGVYLEDCPRINVTHRTFWDIMILFLNATNNMIQRERNKK